jgi:hypothetical protein
MLFGLFSSKPPVGVREKAWSEARMGWLAREFGPQRLLQAQVVVPDDRWFPEPYAPTPDGARRLMARVCGFMDLDPSRVRLEVCDDQCMPGAAGLYEPGVVRLAESQLADPPALVAVLAHELAHDLLHGRNLLRDDIDAEWVTDLLPVFLGLGVFTANATLREKTHCHGHISWWTMQRRGYLTSTTIGYALALFAWARGERKPEWARFLRADAAHTLARGLRYLHSTGDSLFSPGTLGLVDRAASWHGLLEQIEHGSPSASVAGMWGLAELAADANRESLARAVSVVRARLAHALPGVRSEAARAVALLGEAADPAVDDLLQLLADQDDDVRVAAVYALGRLAMEPQKVVPHLVDALDEPILLRPAAAALAAFQRAAEQASPRLEAALQAALATTEYADVDCLARAVESVVADPQAGLLRVLAACDAELRPQAEYMLASRHPMPDVAYAPGAWFGG